MTRGIKGEGRRTVYGLLSTVVINVSSSSASIIANDDQINSVFCYGIDSNVLVRVNTDGSSELLGGERNGCPQLLEGVVQLMLALDFKEALEVRDLGIMNTNSEVVERIQKVDNENMSTYKFHFGKRSSPAKSSQRKHWLVRAWDNLPACATIQPDSDDCGRLLADDD
ncbi:hypothetical protein GNI_073870 [Gregarina niphandrodes]|uniref:Uncharacterized protein n=1 Tax=Gregarina niphandrodes TaxID=110365 RepID=A0A023B748_GRENI|nr:hypothetical protein GNI_073870 [Gregarina niphandrodes]EZG66931.1 hypothetical protein GNI_073870 [Gregarina niphandrodes]|eukprot:XP_011130421.1 hypothetical protein GNI_073870 [Gregarina niphandrodes]